MLKRFTVMFLGLFLLSGCSDGARDYFKKSANNKLIDREGFQGDKHPPLYNKKYVKIAKRNVLEENFDDDDDELTSEYDTETLNPTLRNRQMYLEMVKQDTNRVKKKKMSGGKDNSNTLSSASAKVNKENFAKDEARIEKELEQIKLMLKETKKELERYSCSAKSSGSGAAVPSGTESDVVLPNKLPAVNSMQGSKKSSSTKTQMKKFLSEDFDDNTLHNTKSTGHSAEEENNSHPRAISM